jgi:predicted nucleic acid-binding protein
MIAIDTNIFVYSVDAAEPERRANAAQLLADLQSDPEPTIILWQVLVEIGAVLSRKSARGQLSVPIAALVSAWLGLFKLQLPSQAVALDVWRLIDRHQLSYFDALIIAACIDSGVTKLYSEDLPGKPVIEGVQIINPFTS